MRVACVVVRYGTEVNGGSEQLCRQVAERMAGEWDVEIVTTCALDYMTWRNEYAPGKDAVNGVAVHRFPVDRPRDVADFNRLSERVLEGPSDRETQLAWMRAQGPCSTPLLDYLRAHAGDYDRFVYFTYLYATTFDGLPLTADRSVLVPTAHDEPPIYLDIFRDVFRLPRALVFNTPEEQAFVNARFATAATPQTVAGVGVDVPADVDPGRFRRAHAGRLGGAPFVLYAGRIDPSKGCDHLFDYFLRYRRQRPEGAPKLVLLGRSVMEVPASPDIVELGFVSEREKFDALAAAQLVILPSVYESLSMVGLEAWAVGRPVLVNGFSDVLRGQCLRGQGGLWYESYAEFAEALAMVLSRPELQTALGEAGRAFVAAHYTWPRVEARYRALVSEPAAPVPAVVSP